MIPNPKILTDLKIPDEHKIIITVRGPATAAHYFVQESEELFEKVIDYLSTLENVLTVILPRDIKRYNFIKYRWAENCTKRKIIVPEHAVDALSLMWYSDLVISGGGTMNREAAALGIPVYSIFQGKTGAVDRYLSDIGQLILVNNNDDIRNKIRIEKRSRQRNPLKNSEALGVILQSIQKIIDYRQT